ncbi:uncharacterized protein LOC134263113 [Saccostrea cucullata]|uniref:uncharacterized protein LOC134263113 n=1 Tax=Saccostrea cuccullata TaxID=36930 RepID=UPI002ED07D92
MCSVLNTMSKRISGKFCVAAGCTSTNRDNVSLHEFPKEEIRPEIRRLWITFVKTKRKDFTNPTKYSVLCEKHFAPKCYPQEYLIKESMGFEVKRKSLLPDAMPTVHTVDVSCPEKRPNPYASPSHQGASERPSQPKKMRAAFRKRECMRVLQPESSASVKNNESVETGADSCNDLDKSEQSKTRTVGMQVNRKPVFKRSKYSQVKPQLKEKGVQVDIRERPKMISAGTQCNRDLEEFELSRKRKKPKLTQRSYMNDDVDYTAPIYTDERNKDSDYEPNLSDDSLSDTYSEENSQSEGTGVWNERKFIVFESNLLELFRYCSSCSSVTLFAVKKILGSLVQVEQICGSCGHHRIWNSQPMTGSIPSGNLLLSAAILFTGLLPSKALRFLEHLHIQTITANTFFQHQKHYLHPSSNEVKSSYHMEKEGFIRSTNHIQERGIKIKEIITDRHVQIVKHIREEMQETVHHFDVWHVAKGLKKKLTAMSKEKGCEQLQEWIRSICNHLYWSAASTPDGNGRLMLEEWQSVANHVQNIHEHDGELYDTCPHGPLEGIERPKK